MSSEATSASFLGESRFRSALGESLDASPHSVIYFTRIIQSVFWLGRLWPDTLAIESTVRAPLGGSGLALGRIGGSQDAIYGGSPDFVHAGRGGTIFELYPRSFGVFRFMHGNLSTSHFIEGMGAGPPLRDRVIQRLWVSALRRDVDGSFPDNEIFRLSASDFGIEKRRIFPRTTRYHIGGDHTKVFFSANLQSADGRIGKIDPETLEEFAVKTSPGPSPEGIGGGRSAVYLIDPVALRMYVLDPITLEVRSSRFWQGFGNFRDVGGA